MKSEQEYLRGMDAGQTYAIRTVQLPQGAQRIQDEIVVVETNLHQHTDSYYRQGWADGAKTILLDHKHGLL